MRRVVYSNPDGSVSVFHPAVTATQTEDEAIAIFLTKRIPASAANVKVIEHTQLPRRHPATRDAWTWDGSVVGIDLARAKNLCRTRSVRAGKPIPEAALNAVETIEELEALAEGRLE